VFLNLLSNDEKRAFAVLAEKMIEADGIVVGREAATLAAFRGEMGVAVGSDEAEKSIEELAQVFEDRRSKVAALLELIGLGYSDTTFGVTERSLTTEVAKHMGIGVVELLRLEEWVQEHVRLIRQALTLMRE
jgi:hypothetical protein